MFIRPVLNNGRRAFTILEVMIALMIFSMGSAAIWMAIGRMDKMYGFAYEEIVLAFIEKDLQVRNQIRAFTCGDTQATTNFADNYAGWGIRDPASYDAMCASTLISRWNDNSLYRTFDYYIQDVTHMYDTGTADAESVAARTLEDNQFVDFNGYGRVDERAIGVDVNRDGVLSDNVALDPTGILPPTPSNGVTFNSAKMKNYMKLLKLTVGWDPRILNPGAAATETARLMYLQSGRSVTVYFSVYNPDRGKRR